MSERRHKIVWLSSEAVFTLLGGWFGYDCIQLPVLELPSGERCDVVDVCHSWERGAFGIKLHHKSFPDVPDGQHCPTLNPDVTLRMIRMNYQPRSADESMAVTVPEPR